MTTGNHDFAILLERLDRLEAYNRRLKFLILITFMGAIACFGLARLQALQTASAFSDAAAPRAEAAEKTIEAERFVLKDQSGKRRAMMSVGKLGPSISLWDSTGERRRLSCFRR